MFASDFQDGVDMLIRKGVKNLLALAAGPHQLAFPKDLQLVGNGRLGHGQIVRDLTDIFFGLEQSKHDLDAGGVAENFKQIRQS